MKLSIAAKISQRNRHVVNICVFEALGRSLDDDSIQPFLYIMDLFDTHFVDKGYEDQLKQAIEFYRPYEDFSGRFEP